MKILQLLWDSGTLQYYVNTVHKTCDFTALWDGQNMNNFRLLQDRGKS